ncbi:MAG: hypothetical protein Q9217_006554 [Psora testacea]
MEAIGSTSMDSLPPEEPPLYQGRISSASFEAFLGASYGCTMIIAFVRLVLQIKTHRRLYIDDYFLIFACVCLTVSTVLGYAKVGDLYWSQQVNYNPTHVYYLLMEHVDIASHITAYQRLYFSYPAFLWAAIFSIKFGYLAFLRRLLQRIKPLIICWRIVVAVTIVSLPVCIASIYLGCMKFGLDAASCAQPVYVRRFFALSILDMVLDIVTDMMIVAIPLKLLWYVKIKPRQKLILGIFFSLNLFMAVTAGVRVSGLHIGGSFDVVWLYVWQHAEACVAVAMISLTAFRSAFVESQSSRARKEGAKRPWYSGKVDAIKRTRQQRAVHGGEIQELPKIPSATLTGMRTMIEAGRPIQASHHLTSSSLTPDDELEEWPLSHNQGTYGPPV